MAADKPKGFTLGGGTKFTSADVNAEGRVMAIATEALYGPITVVPQDTICEDCGKLVQEHPYCGRILSNSNQPFLYVLCSRVRVQVQGDGC